MLDFLKKGLLLFFLMGNFSPLSAYCITITQEGLDAATRDLKQYGKQAVTVKSVDILVFSTDERFVEYLKAMGIFRMIQSIGIGILATAIMVFLSPVYMTPIAGPVLTHATVSPLVRFLQALKTPIYDPYSSDAIMEGVHKRFLVHEHQGVEVPVAQREGAGLPALPVLRKRFSGVKAGDKECWPLKDIRSFFRDLSIFNAPELTKWGVDAVQQKLIWNDMLAQGFLKDGETIATFNRLFFVIIDHETRNIIDAQWVDDLNAEMSFGAKNKNTGEIEPILQK